MIPHLQRFSFAQNVFRFISYNILAEILEGYHKYCPKPLRSWSNRAPKIFQELLELQADIIALQEVDKHNYEEHVKPFFSFMGFQSLYCGRDSPGQPDFGVVLLFKTQRFTCQASRLIKFSDHALAWCPAALGSSFMNDLVGVNNGVATMALLQDKTGGSGVVAVSTHIFWDPKYPDVKAGQAAILCQQVQQFIGDVVPSGSPEPAVVIGGDFNSLWRKYKPDDYDKVIPRDGYLCSGVYTLMSEGCLKPDHPDHPINRRADASQQLQQVPLDSAGLRLFSLHHACKSFEPPFTDCTHEFAGCLDYVFCSQQHCRPVSCLNMPYGMPHNDLRPGHPDDTPFPPMPNSMYPSDHLPVGGDFMVLCCNLEVTPSSTIAELDVPSTDHLPPPWLIP